MYTVGIDIGATKIIFVLMKNQRVLKAQKVLTPKNKKELINLLKANISKLSESCSWPIGGIGIGVPGPLTEKRDLILNPPNLRALRNCPLAKIIEKNLKIRTIMDNDVNCFTLGESIVGAGKGAKIVFGITLGSGVGGGIIIKSKIKNQKSKIEIYRGASGSAGEVGHMTIKFDGLKCTCGSYGCFEEYCSERFFLRKRFLPKDLQRKAEKNDKKALEAYNKYGKYLGIGLSNVINILDPEVIVVGGGIAKAGKFFLPAARKEVKQRVLSLISKKNVKIKKAALSEFGGAIGAALLNYYD